MIRIATEADVPEMLAIYAPYIENTTCTFEYNVPTREEFLARFRDITAQFPWLVWEEEGKILGYAYGSAPFARDAYRWCAEDSVYLLPQAQGKGIGKKLIAALEQVLSFQGYCRIYALITAENEISIRFHEKIGYRVCGNFQNAGYKFNRWIGVVWMDKTLNFVDFPSNFPASWKDVMQDRQSFSNILDILSLF